MRRPALMAVLIVIGDADKAASSRDIGACLVGTLRRGGVLLVGFEFPQPRQHGFTILFRLTGRMQLPGPGDIVLLRRPDVRLDFFPDDPATRGPQSEG